MVVRLGNQHSGLPWLSKSQVVTGSLSLLCLTTFWFLTYYLNKSLWCGDKKPAKSMKDFFFLLPLLEDIKMIILIQASQKQSEMGIHMLFIEGVLLGETCKEVREAGKCRGRS